MRAIWSGLAVMLLGALPALADDFHVAMDHWLAMEDAQALPMLADLATAGDERAMMVLAVLGQDWPGSDWLRTLDRKSRNAIMRAPGGLSGKSWLTMVKDQRALADALTKTTGADDFAERTTVLFQMGESAAGRRVAMAGFNYDPSMLAAIDAVTLVPDVMAHMLWYSAGFASNPLYWEEGGTREPTAHEAALLAEAASPDVKDSFQQRIFLSLIYPDAASAGVPLSDYLTDTALRLGEVDADLSPLFGEPMAAGVAPGAARTQAYDAAADILMRADELAPMRGICQAACPDAVRDCVRTVYGNTLRLPSLVYLGPPLSSLTPEDRYFASPRYLDDLRNLARPAPTAPPAYAACGLALLHAAR